MGQLVFASLFFIGLHTLVAGTGVRRHMVAQMGEGAYRGVFSIASLGGLVALMTSYAKAFASSENRWLWGAPVGLMHAGVLVMFVAVFFVVQGLTTPSPTTAGMEGRLEDPDAVKGILRITRHPFLWGVGLWSMFHLGVNGDLASILLFSTFVVVAFTGTRSIDRKRAENYGAAWTAFCERTSNVPFWAIKERRNRIVWRELLGWRLMPVLAAFAAILAVHRFLFGVSPIPGWVPPL